MLIRKGVSKEFLYRFTKEIILNLRKEILKKELQRLEDQRVKRQIEKEKLRVKFSAYLTQQKINLKKPQEIKKVFNPILDQNLSQSQKKLEEKPRVIPQKVNINEYFPSINSQQQAQTIVEEKEIPKKTIPQNQEIQKMSQETGEFGKLSFLIKNPIVTYIECPGENKSIIIKRAGGLTKTQIILNKEEIKSLVEIFSQKARIPLVEGLLNARVGNLEISAVISEAASSSFIIRKDIIPSIRQNKPTQLLKPKF